MDISVNARKLMDTLKGFKPNRKKYGLHEAYVRASAGGGVLVLIGTFDNSASLPVEVKTPGSVNFPLETTLKLLKAHKGKESIQIRTDDQSIWIGPVKMPLRP